MNGGAPDTVVVTCEHGGNHIPAPYQGLFAEQSGLLASHRGYDAGALVMAKELAAALGAPLVSATISRLLIDLNRSIGHRQLFSAVTRGLPTRIRGQIVEDHYRPYRDEVEHLVGQAVASGRRVIHLSSHSFTPELNGTVRCADVGILYDPRRVGEAALSARWKKSLAASAPDLRVRRNYPYAGKGDGLTSHLRSRFTPGEYIGIELEVNQGIVLAGAQRWSEVRQVLISSLRAAGMP